MTDDATGARRAAAADAGEVARGGGEGEPLTLEGKLQRLSEIVAFLEAEDVELDRALDLFEEGIRHIRDAEAILSRAELRVEELVGEGDEARTRPFEPDVGDSAEEGA